MNKYKVQVNGESISLLDDMRERDHGGMFDSEYEFIIECKQKDINTIRELLERVNNENEDIIFNYSILTL